MSVSGMLMTSIYGIFFLPDERRFIFHEMIRKARDLGRLILGGSFRNHELLTAKLEGGDGKSFLENKTGTNNMCGCEYVCASVE